MSSIERLNLRVYGFCLWQRKLLLCREEFMGKQIVKLPGGGWEQGEGLEETLVREVREELDQGAQIIKHLYTTGHFIQSAIRSDEQLMLVYYQFRLEQPENAAGNYIDDEGCPIEFFWKALDDLDKSDFSLPSDQILWERCLVDLADPATE
jgi:ADP-ribose pyrophosphatase YjhB (NUDIX family)